MNADYIVWEAHGRKDYTFSQQVRSTKCVSDPQKRSDFKEERRSDGTIDLSWAPDTYHSCEEDGPPVKLSGAYEVSPSLFVFPPTLPYPLLYLIFE